MKSKDNKLYNGDVCSYQDVVEAQDEKLLQACEQAVTILKNNNWKSMGYEKKFRLYPRTDFEVKNKIFSDCKVFVFNDEGTLITRLVGKISPKSLDNDFCIDLATHPQVGEDLLKRNYSAEAYLQSKYSK